jgi:hypothetical protein
MATDLQLVSKNGAIKGNLGAQFVNCTIKPASQGGAPPAGVYQMLLHSNDPFYGSVALLVAARGSSAGTPSAKWTWVKGGAPKAGITATWVQGGEPPTAMWWHDSWAPKVGGSARVYVISDKRVPGRNSLIVSSGFPALLAALQSAGSASVTVS